MDDGIITAEPWWHEVMAAWGVPAGKARSAAFVRLAMAYAEPQRYYHRLPHINDVVSVLYHHQHELTDWRSVFLAAFYHDIVYDPRRSDNEERSARFLDEAMCGLGLTDVQRACDLILMTKSHAAPEEDSDAQFLLGADLAILATPAEQYERYRVAIRKEYDWVPEREFNQGRRAVLERFVARPRIYQSELLYHWEPRARANLAAEIAQLDKARQQLDPPR